MRDDRWKVYAESGEGIPSGIVQLHDEMMLAALGVLRHRLCTTLSICVRNGGTCIW